MARVPGDAADPQDRDRPVAPVSEAAKRLRVSGSRVHQLLESKTEPLDGPPPPGRGRYRVRFVYVDTIDKQLERRRSRRQAGARAANALDALTKRVDNLAEQLAALRERINHLPGERNPSTQPVARATANSADELRWALQHLNAATDALHEAAAREAEVRELQRTVLERQQRALERQEQAAAAIRRSDRLRSEVIGVLLLPDAPDDLLS